MAKGKKKKNFKRSKTPNEFDEILDAKLKKDPLITQDDIVDMQIDMELYNKAATKALKKKNDNKGTRKCERQYRSKEAGIARTKKGSLNTLKGTRKNSD